MLLRSRAGNALDRGRREGPGREGGKEGRGRGGLQGWSEKSEASNRGEGSFQGLVRAGGSSVLFKSGLCNCSNGRGFGLFGGEPSTTTISFDLIGAPNRISREP